MKSILTGTGIVVLVFASLLTFPEHLHWILGGWAGLALLNRAVGKPVWPWLFGAALIFAIKQPGYTFEYWAVITAFVVTALHDALTKKTNRGRTGQSLGYGLLLMAAIAFFAVQRWLGSNCSEQRIADGRPIACLGDSLTDYGYPQELEKLISLPVVDFGVDGITTDDGIEMLPEILATDPQLVVLELGGHDYNAEKKPRKDTKANLESLITAFLDHGVAVILVEIPRGFITDPYSGVERELAAKYDLQLIDDSLIRRFIFFGPIIPPGTWLNEDQRLSDDGLHPNDLGNRYFASVVRDALVAVFGNAITSGTE